MLCEVLKEIKERCLCVCRCVCERVATACLTRLERFSGSLRWQIVYNCHTYTHTHTTYRFHPLDTDRCSSSHPCKYTPGKTQVLWFWQRLKLFDQQGSLYTLSLPSMFHSPPLSSPSSLISTSSLLPFFFLLTSSTSLLLIFLLDPLLPSYFLTFFPLENPSLFPRPSSRNLSKMTFLSLAVVMLIKLNLQNHLTN